MALAPPDCGGSCAPWQALVVAACAVGCWAVDTVLLCTAPGLWAQWVVAWGGTLGAVRLPMWWWWRGIVAFGGSLPGRSTRSASRSSVQRQGCPWPTVVVGCVLGVPRWRSWWWRCGIVAVGGGSTRGWVLGDRHHALVCSARAFEPGGRWYGGVPLVPFDCRRRCRGAWWWPLVGRDMAVVGDQHRALVRNARAFGPGGW